MTLQGYPALQRMFNIIKERELYKLVIFFYTLSREYAVSRGNFSLWILLTFLCLFSGHWLPILTKLHYSNCLFLSMKKHSGKIDKIIKDFKSQQECSSEKVKTISK